MEDALHEVRSAPPKTSLPEELHSLCYVPTRNRMLRPEEVRPMTKPIRVQLSRRKGWRMPPNTVKVARPTKWGNPFRVGIDGTRGECVDQFKQYLAVNPASYRTERIKDQLRGKNLACFCRPGDPCHADVLLEIANT